MACIALRFLARISSCRVPVLPFKLRDFFLRYGKMDRKVTQLRRELRELLKAVEQPEAHNDQRRHINDRRRIGNAEKVRKDVAQDRETAEDHNGNAEQDPEQALFCRN